MEKNKIYLGDSYELIKQLSDKSVDCIYTDIPYLLQSGGSGHSALSKRIIKTNYVDIAEIRNGIDYAIFEEFRRVMKKVNLFIWCSKGQLQDIMNYWIDDNVNFELLVWCKTNPVPATNNLWLPDIEYCLYFREVGVKLNDGYKHKSKWYISPINTVDKAYYKHPTIKPLELVKQHLAHTTQEGDIVLDPFIGSGTTAVACQELNRNYIGYELNEEYHKIAVDRTNGVDAYGRRSLF